MSTDCYQCSFSIYFDYLSKNLRISEEKISIAPAQVLVQFILQLNKAVITVLIKSDVSQNGCDNVWSDCGSLLNSKTQEKLI